MHHTTRTVLRNLTDGIILVVIVLLLFLGNLRGAVIVALTIPFSLLFAAVVMIENIVRHLNRNGTDQRTPAQRIFDAAQVVNIMRQVKGIEDLGVFRVLGQPNLNLTVNRAQTARYQINIADVQDAIQTAVGGNALTQVLQGEPRYDLVMRYLPRYRDKKEAIQNIRLLSPTGERVSLAQLCNIEERDGASEIYREGNQRYVAIKYSVRGRDLGGAVKAPSCGFGPS